MTHRISALGRNPTSDERICTGFAGIQKSSIVFHGRITPHGEAMPDEAFSR
jgi:hypothetical protein